ncbi:hypothetical protein AVEN_97766-1 [Araneus ventricosus]|uniref:Uncharacterized protein n=1 Tax=Araneus ventricosus TaxID=182803 RepID=A0A4Y2WUT3_ARAVE|nr:hypothetical protein AVEN_97766-1 [Araneus ventricosus]
MEKQWRVRDLSDEDRIKNRIFCSHSYVNSPIYNLSSPLRNFRRRAHAMFNRNSSTDGTPPRPNKEGVTGSEQSQLGTALVLVSAYARESSPGTLTTLNAKPQRMTLSLDPSRLTRRMDTSHDTPRTNSAPPSKGSPRTANGFGCP